MFSTEEADVVVVGAGMAGLKIANVLAQAGAQVICLEQGPSVAAVDHPTFTSDWEFSIGREWAFNPNVRSLDYDYPVATNGTFQPYLYNAVGGSTNHYSAFWHRLKPVDFLKGTEHGLEGAIDWPITYEDLERFYDLTDNEIGISGLVGDRAYPERPGADRLPLVAHGNYERIIAQGLEKLDVHWWPADNAILTQGRGHRMACNSCGMCNLGCPRGALGTAQDVYLPAAQAAGLDLRSGSRVSSLTTDVHGNANGVIYTDIDSSTERRINARLIVVSANGIGTPRLLLMSEGVKHPRGLGNNHDQVGRYFMTHGYRLGDMWFDRSTEHYKGPFGAGPYVQEWYDTDMLNDFVNGVTITFGGAWGAAGSALGGTTRTRPAAWGSAHHAEFEQLFDRHIFCAIQADDLPVASNRVTLDPVLKDAGGLPAANVHYDLHDNTRKLLEFGSDRLAEIAEAAGAIGLDMQPMDENFSQPGWHLMGTARMSSHASEGVTDKWNRVWDTPGLVVCDGSSMASGGAGNPTATIVSLAARCAENLVRSMGKQIEASDE